MKSRVKGESVGVNETHLASFRIDGCEFVDDRLKDVFCLCGFDVVLKVIENVRRRGLSVSLLKELRFESARSCHAMSERESKKEAKEKEREERKTDSDDQVGESQCVFLLGNILDEIESVFRISPFLDGHEKRRGREIRSGRCL